jgi:hypothetical protein
MGYFDECHPMGACAQGECTCCIGSRNYEHPMPWLGASQAGKSFAWEDRYKKGDRKCCKCAVMKTSKVRSSPAERFYSLRSLQRDPHAARCGRQNST